MPIRIRLTLWFTLLLTAMLAFLGILLYEVLNMSLHDQLDRSLYDRAQQVLTGIEFQSIKLGDDQFLIPEANIFSSPATFIQVIQADGKVLSTSDNLHDWLIPLDNDMLADNLNGQSGYKTVVIADALLRIYSTPIIFNNQVFGAVQVGQSLNEVEIPLRHVLFFLAIGAIAALVLAAIIGAFLAWKALQPIEKLNLAADRIVGGRDLKQRLPRPTANDEIAHLTDTINNMLQRLDNFFQAQVRLSADVSHELRTPLTAIRGNLDLLRHSAAHPPECYACNREELHEAIAVIESELDRMSRLVADLLLLSQADAGLSLRMQPVELDTLILDVYRQARALANGVNIHLGHEDQAMVQGDPDRLKQLLINLMVNAIKYTPSGGDVTLALYHEAEWVQITVSDTGRGIASTDLPHIFDRFYRAENNGQAGSGLGLSIAQWIAHAHNGQITVTSEVDRGAVFTLWLPRPAV